MDPALTKAREIAQDGEINKAIVLLKKAVLAIVPSLRDVQCEIGEDKPRVPRHPEVNERVPRPLTDMKITYVVRN